MAITKVSRGLLNTGISDSSDATAITIDSSENVGIGTISPNTLLHASTGSNSSGLIDVARFQNAGTTVNDGARIQLTSGTSTSGAGIGCLGVALNSAHLVFHSGGNNERMRIDSSGNVGIGTTSPSNKLHVEISGNNGTYADADNPLFLKNSSTTDGATVGQYFGCGNGVGVVLTTHFPNADTNGEGHFAISTRNSSNSLAERMRIDSSGNLAIGTTTANGKINVYYSSVFGEILRYTGSTTTVYPLIFEYGGATAGSISITSSATSYNTSSDYRLKENVNYEFDALTRVKQLKPARFNFIADADKTVDGFIAHEVSDIVPEAITGEKDGEQMQGIDQSKLVPLLTKAIQEQQEIIDDLKARIEDLEA